MESNKNIELINSSTVGIKCEPTANFGDDCFEFEYVQVKQEVVENVIDSQPIVAIPVDYKPSTSTTVEGIQYIEEPKFRITLCHICKKAFPSNESCEEHLIKAHKKELPFQCRICKKRFKRSQHRNKHERIHNPDRYSGTPKFPCDMCEKKYYIESTLINHRRYKHLGFKKFRKNYTDAATQQRSLKGVKNPFIAAKKKIRIRRRRGTGLRKCDKCGKTFRNQERQDKHVLKGTPTAKKPYQCQLCCRTFTIKYLLNKHIKRKHPNYNPQNRLAPIKPRYCSTCDIVFPLMIAFKRHMQTVHNELPYKCEICKKTFSKQVTMLQHRSTHLHDDSRLRSYQCRICGKFEANKFTALKDHIKVFHGVTMSKKKNVWKCFACGTCGKEYYLGISAILCALQIMEREV